MATDPIRGSNDLSDATTMPKKGFDQYSTLIHPEWLDYNEHMNDAAYALALGAANEAFLNFAQIGAAYREQTGATMYTVEAHLYYLAEVHSNDRLHAETRIGELGTKKLRLVTTLTRNDGKPAARGEFVYLHYDHIAQKVIPFPDEVQQRLSELDISLGPIKS